MLLHELRESETCTMVCSKIFVSVCVRVCVCVCTSSCVSRAKSQRAVTAVLLDTPTHPTLLSIEIGKIKTSDGFMVVKFRPPGGDLSIASLCVDMILLGDIDLVAILVLDEWPPPPPSINI